MASKYLTPEAARADSVDRLDRVVHTAPGCWQWGGCVDAKGYGHISYHGRDVRAHRIVYELLVGPIPNGLTIDHLCRNRACVNPAHLEPVTIGANVLRGVGPTARHARVTHCPRGHPYDEANTYRSKKGRECRTCMSLKHHRAYLAKRSSNG